MQHVVLMEEIVKSYSGVQVLKAVDLSLRQGEFLGLVGENGAGKSTLIKVLSGVVPRDSGKISINGQPVTIDSPQQARANGISVVHQSPSLVPYLSVVENLFMGKEDTNKLGFMNWKSMKERAQKLCERVGLHCNVMLPVGELSFVEQQLVSIACALSDDMNVIILDEPTASMDSSAKERLFDVLKQLKEEGVSAIYISHLLEEVFDLTDRITVLRDGRNVDTVQTADTKVSDVIGMMLGETLERQFPERIPNIKDEVFLKTVALEHPPYFSGINMELHKGEILGVFGSVGAGKTELFRCLFGVDEFEGGSLFIHGAEVKNLSPRQAIRKGIFLMPEDRREHGLVSFMGIRDNTLLSNPSRSNRWRLFKDHKQEKEDTQELIRNLKIKATGDAQPAETLSGGNQQKVVLGKGLYTESRVFLFDEPTKGVDVGAKAEIYRIISELAENGAGVILATAELSEALELCDRIIVMHRNEQLGVFSADDLDEKSLLSLSLTGAAS